MSIVVEEKRIHDIEYVESLYEQFIEPTAEWEEECLSECPDLPLMVYQLLFWSTIPIDSNKDLNVCNPEDLYLLHMLEREQTSLEMNSMKLEATYKEKVDVVHEIAESLKKETTLNSMPALDISRLSEVSSK